MRIVRASLDRNDRLTYSRYAQAHSSTGCTMHFKFECEFVNNIKF